jgi:hypothetical protein
MSLDPPWAVLAPVDPARLEQRVLAALEFDEDERDRVKFEIVRGSGRYHAIIGTPEDEGVEKVIAEFLSLECPEPVYSILGSEPAVDGWFPALVDSYRRGVKEHLHLDPHDLARFLGCPFPEPPGMEEQLYPFKTVALVEGVPVQEALRALEESAKPEGFPCPQESLRIAETPRGLLLASGAFRLAGAHIGLAEQLPRATVYEVTTTPDLDPFFVRMYHGEGMGEFAHPQDATFEPPTLSEIKGERSPERILAALGIPPEWFQQ